MNNPYTQQGEMSYTLGLFPSLTLLEKKPSLAKKLLLSEKAKGEGVQKLRDLCEQNNCPIVYADKVLKRLSGKDNCYAGVMFEKWESTLSATSPHVVLHNPMDAGNLGTIIRTLLGFNIVDLAIITPAVDHFDPKVVRATMGAHFSINFATFNNFEDYQMKYKRNLYPFMLDGKPLDTLETPIKTPYTLIFGNEGQGLPDYFIKLGQAVKIPHSNQIDSLNLSVAVAIGAYTFIQKEKMQ